MPEISAPASARHESMLGYFASPDFDADLETVWNRKYFFGDWLGLRSCLAENGVTVGLNYVADILGNPVGGRSRGFAYTGSMGLDVMADLEELARLEGWQFHTAVVWRAGTSLSRDKIDNVFNVAQVYGGQNVRLYALDLRREFDDGRYLVKFGRIAQGDDFLSSPLYWNYVNNAFDGNPVAVFFNAPMQAYPNATWGAMFKAEPLETWYGQAGIYGADTDLNRNSAHGLDWGFQFNKGAFIIAQTGYRRNQGSGDTGLPGTYSIGGYYVTGRFDRFTNPQSVRGTYGTYIMLEQMLYRHGAAEAGRGLTGWSTLLLAPSDRSQMPLFVSGGLVYHGLLPARAKDVTAFGFVYGGFSGDLREMQGQLGAPQQRYETVLELTHRIQMNEWFYIQPDVQYIINPGGARQYSNALVFGAQVGITF